jgi:hypothetical protein
MLSLPTAAIQKRDKSIQFFSCWKNKTKQNKTKQNKTNKK